MEPDTKAWRWMAAGLPCLGLAALVAASMLGRSAPLAPEHAGPGVTELVVEALKFARIPTSDRGPASRSTWPSETAFRQTHEQWRGPRPRLLLRGRAIALRAPAIAKTLAPEATWDELLSVLPAVRRRQARHERLVDVRDCPDVYLVLASEDGRYVVSQVIGRDGCYVGRSALPRLPVSTDDPVVHVSESEAFGFKPSAPVRVSDMDPALWQLWTYVTTVMKLERPLYVEDLARPIHRWDGQWEALRKHGQQVVAALERGKEPGLEAINRVIRDRTRLVDHHMEACAAFAEKHGALETARTIRSRFQPVGTCSMDTRPQEAARAYSDLCFKMGDVACYLNLRFRIMANAFSRIMHSPYADEVDATDAERLHGVGIDVLTLFKGLVVAFEVPGTEYTELGPSRLARWIVEAGVVAPMKAFLTEVATSSTIDSYNRLRSAQVLAYIHSEEKEPARFDESGYAKVRRYVREKMRRLKLSEEATLWMGLAYAKE